MGQSYYQLLEVAQNATTKEIRDSYIIKIRQYPAEFHPDQFRLIQEAYDVLFNEEKRAKYDLEFIHGEEIKQFMDLALNSYEENDFENAQYYFSKVLSFNPKDTNVINYYGLSMLENGHFDEAIDQFLKAIQIQDENPTYYYNLASAYEYKKDYQSATRFYKQSLLRNPSDFEIVQRLAYLYHDLDDFENAWNIVEVTMKKSQVTGQIRFLYIKLLLEIASLNGASFEMKIALKYALKFINETVENKEYGIDKLISLTIDFAKIKKYKFAKQIIDFVVSIEKNSKLLELQRTIQENYILFNEFDQLIDDENIIRPLRYKTYLYLFSDEVEDFEGQSNDTNERIMEACEREPRNVLNSLKRCKSAYPAISKELDSFFDLVESYV